jgi:putative proteasome-type protease
LVLYRRGSYELVEHRYQREDLNQISSWWQERMRGAVDELPSKWVEAAFSKLGGSSPPVEYGSDVTEP